jgi:hypothetical protein
LESRHETEYLSEPLERITEHLCYLYASHRAFSIVPWDNRKSKAVDELPRPSVGCRKH